MQKKIYFRKFYINVEKKSRIVQAVTRLEDNSLQGGGKKKTP